MNDVGSSNIQQQSLTEVLFMKHSQLNNNRQNDESCDSYISSTFHGLVNRTANILRMIPLVKHLVGPPVEKDYQISSLLAQQKAAINYKTWHDTSLQLDYLLKNSEWKHTLESDLYDYEMVLNNLQELRRARIAKDNKLLLYLVRTTWVRNLGNMGNVNLYRHSHVGTKKLIEEYITECEEVLEYLISGDSNMDDRYLLGMLIQTRKNIGRTALVLSGGGCFGLFHIGVLSTLLEANVLPRIISGSSAGGIIASILCSRTNEELVPFIASITDRKFTIFEDPDHKETFISNLSRFLKYGTWFDNIHIKETMIDFLGDLTFRECYNRTGKILNITVSPASVHEQPRLLNYLTAPSVLIWSAVCASCALPGIFSSSTIYEKNAKTGEVQEWNNASVKFVDGSVDNDLPITRLSEMFNVDHIIACQVNPHVVPFLKMSVACVGGEIENEYSAKLKQLLTNVYGMWSSEVMHYLDMAEELGIASNLATKLRSVLAQQYSGDITILPDLRITELPKVLINPTPEFLLDATVRGARATWPKITLIKNHCSVEFALDKAISLLRSRLISTKMSNIGNLYLLVNSPVINDLANDSESIAATAGMSGGSEKLSNYMNPRHQRHRSASEFNSKIRKLSITVDKEKILNKSAFQISSLMTPQSAGATPQSKNRRRGKTLSSSSFSESKAHFQSYSDSPTEVRSEIPKEKTEALMKSPQLKFSERSSYYDSNGYFDTVETGDNSLANGGVAGDTSPKLQAVGVLKHTISNQNLNKKQSMNLPAASSPKARSLRNSLVGLNHLSSSYKNISALNTPLAQRRHSYKGRTGKKVASNLASSPDQATHKTIPKQGSFLTFSTTHGMDPGIFDEIIGNEAKNGDATIDINEAIHIDTVEARNISDEEGYEGYEFSDGSRFGTPTKVGEIS